MKVFRLGSCTVWRCLLWSAILLVSHSLIAASGALPELSLKTLPSALASDAGIKGLPQWPHDHSDLKPDPAVKFGRFDNGFRYVLMENNEPKDRVSLHLNVQSGSLHERENEQGLAHFLEHMLFNGSTHFPPGSLISYFQSIGMQLGPDANARTGFIDTIYDILLPAGDEKTIGQGLLVIEDYAQGALLLPEELESERKVVLAEMKNRDSAGYRTFVSTLQFEFPDAQISKRLPIGKENVIKAMDQSLLKSFYDARYRPDNMILVMVGHFDMKTAERLIAKRFSKMEARRPKLPAPDFGHIHHEGVKALYHYEKEEGNTTVTIEKIEETAPQHDSFELQKRLLIQRLADRIVGYRLDDLLRQKDAPFTTATIRSGEFVGNVNFAEISADCDPKNWEKTLLALGRVLHQALAYGFTKSEVERVKKEKLADLENAVKIASTRNSKMLARHMIHALNRDRVVLSPDQEKELFFPVIEKLTAKDLLNAFKKSWAPDHRLILVTGNAVIDETNDPAASKIVSLYNRSQAQPIMAPEEKDIASFPYLPTPKKAATIVSNVFHPDTKVRQIDFGNGVRLNLKKTDFKANEIMMSVVLGKGKSSQPQDKAGMSHLLEGILNESGFGRLNKEDLKRALAGKESGISFEIKEDHFAIRIMSVPDEVELAFQLLYAQMADPGFKMDAYDLVMKRLKQEYDSLNHAVDGAIKLFGARFLAGGDTRFGAAEPDQLNRLSLSDVKQWITPILAHSPLEINVVGDFDMDEMIKFASIYVGTLPKREKQTEAIYSDLPTFPVGKMLHIEVDTQLPQGLVVMSFPTDDIWDIHQTRRLSVLAEVLSERLRKQVREKLGAAYSPYAYNRPSKVYAGFGILHAFIKTAPGYVDQVVAEVQKIAENMATKGISEDELQSSLGPMLTNIKDIKRKNDYWVNTVLSGSTDHPEKLLWAQSIIDDYKSITTKDISMLAKKYLNNEKAATIIVLPEKK